MSCGVARHPAVIMQEATRWRDAGKSCGVPRHPAVIILGTNRLRDLFIVDIKGTFRLEWL
jgi:hypothetical protein